MLIRIRGVVERTGLSKASIYRLIARGDFPQPLALSLRATGWKVADVDEWIASRQRKQAG